MTDKALKGQALRDISFYGAVYGLTVALERGGDAASYAVTVLTFFPRALSGRKTDPSIKEALRPVITKRGTVNAHERTATCWCEWAACAPGIMNDSAG